MQAIKKYLPIALFLGFLFVGLIAFMEGKPSSKNKRIYKIVQTYSPYYLDKRFGGLSIKNKEDKEFKENPNNMTLFKEFERLEKEWGQKHLILKENTLIIKDNNGSQINIVPLQDRNEVEFIHRYYGI
jgi:hypothetical protein